jgi:iron(II)-dependent oxidoreductase
MLARFLFLWILFIFPSALVWADEPATERVVFEPAEFIMGDSYCVDRQGNSDWCSDEIQHNVKLDRFAIDKYEVTNAQYNDCVAAMVCSPAGVHEFRPLEFNLSRQPVIFVNWDSANKYCQWKGGRLPTEAEWERAAQGKNPGGAHFGQNYDSGATKDVGSFTPSASGLFDMMGNVSEWTSDWYAPYITSETQINPKGPETGKNKVVRGGSWNSPRHFLRASDRTARSPELQYSDVGFRCAVSNP